MPSIGVGGVGLGGVAAAADGAGDGVNVGASVGAGWVAVGTAVFTVGPGVATGASGLVPLGIVEVG